MSELKFSRVNNDKYNTVSINIEHAFLTLRDCEILKIEKQSGIIEKLLYS